MLFRKLIDKRIEAYQSDLMKKYCDEVESMYTKMRGWRHDYHNHIQAMQASMALGNYEEVNEYLRQLNADLTNVDTVIKTGRVMVDAILNGKISFAVQNKIPVNAKAKLPEALEMNDVDLCVIIGNLLDIAITNAAGKKRGRSGSHFLSVKGSGHGFGLSRVEAIVKKQDGFFSADSEDGGFTAEVLIPI